MTKYLRTIAATLLLAASGIAIVGGQPAMAESATALDHDARAALLKLYESAPAAGDLAKTAKGILVFPNIVKAGFIVGAQYGDGVLIKKGKTAGYYNITAASYGLQAGVQSFGEALFFMSDAALKQMETSSGFDLGVGPSIVVVDAGMASSRTLATSGSDVFAFTFGQRGLMAGLGLQGSKITKINP